MAKKRTLYAAILFTLVVFFSTAVSVQALGVVSGDRIQGTDRYATSINISQNGWTGSTENAVLTTGSDFPDALSAAPLARKLNAPILLTETDALSVKLEDEFTRLDVKNVYIVGGTKAVSQDIETNLKSKGINVVRVCGNDRYETSVEVAKQLGTPDSIVVATGNDFPDALSIASWAASNNAPILLTGPKGLPAKVSEYIKGNESNIGNKYVIGGEKAISNTIMGQLKNAKRINGNDRYGTNLAVLQTFNSSFSLDKLFLATGNDFPDALSGSALASKTGSPIVLSGLDPLPDTKQYIDMNLGRLDSVYILGGTKALSDSAVANIMPPIVSSIKISMASATLEIGKESKASVSLTMIPADASKPSVVFTTSSPGVLEVGQDGTVTPLQSGTATITATAGNKSSSIGITVKNGNDSKLIVLDPGHGGFSSGAVPTAPDGTKLTDYKESVLNLQIAGKVRDRLLALGYTVVMTRDSDTYVSLEDRAKMANDLNANIFISIHHDSYGPTSTGTSAFYSSYKPGVETDGVYVHAELAGEVLNDSGQKIGSLAAGSNYQYVKEENGSIYIMYNGAVGKVSLDDVMVYDKTPSTASQKSEQLAEYLNEDIASLGLLKRGAKDQNLAVTRLTNGVSALVEVGFLSNYNEFLIISQDSFQDKVADKIVQAIQTYYTNVQ